jgi:hypothetical protein
MEIGLSIMLKGQHSLTKFAFVLASVVYIVYLNYSYESTHKGKNERVVSHIITHVEPLRQEPTKAPTVAFDAQHWQRELRKSGWCMIALYVGNKKEPALEARWTSQVGQDRTIVQLFKAKRNGFFVDLAANDAVALSNSLTLEQEYDWNGICIEANPKYFELLTNRRCQLVQAVVGSQNNNDVVFNFRSEFGGIVGDRFDNKITDSAKTLTTVTLNTIFSNLSVPLVIDYMSLDIEGAEELVLETFPWAKYTFLSITVERPKHGLKVMLQANGYVYVCNHGGFGDQLWLHSTFPDIDDAISGLNLPSKWKVTDEPGSIQCRTT